VAVIVDAVSKKAAEIGAVKDDAEKDLGAAKPALDEALAALNSITPKDIVALKALKSPPDIVKRIFDAVLLLRYWPIDKVSWQESKGVMVLAGSYDTSVKMMGDMGFLTSLLNFAKEQINDETVELLQPYFAAPDFNYEAARKASGNVAGLCNWAAAMCKYHEVAKVVEPKIAALRAAEAELKVRVRLGARVGGRCRHGCAWLVRACRAGGLDAAANTNQPRTCTQPMHARTRARTRNRSPPRRRTPPRSAWPSCRRGWTTCRRSLTRPWRRSSCSRRTPLRARRRWTAPPRCCTPWQVCVFFWGGEGTDWGWLRLVLGYASLPRRAQGAPLTRLDVHCTLLLPLPLRHSAPPPPCCTGEESRWTMQSKEFDAQIQRLTGDCAVASAFVSYLGPFNKEFRELLMSRDFYGDCIKLGIPVTQNIEVRVWPHTCCVRACVLCVPAAAGSACRHRHACSPAPVRPPNRRRPLAGDQVPGGRQRGRGVGAAGPAHGRAQRAKRHHGHARLQVCACGLRACAAASHVAASTHACTLPHRARHNPHAHCIAGTRCWWTRRARAACGS
jgi:hypothetical protein